MLTQKRMPILARKSDESSDEEEIKQIPVAGSKRQKLGSDDEESEE